MRRRTASSAIQRARCALCQCWFRSASSALSSPFCHRLVMPKLPVDPAGWISRATAAPVYPIQFIPSPSARPAPFTSAVAALRFDRFSSSTGPGFVTSVLQLALAASEIAATAHARIQVRIECLPFLMVVIVVSPSEREAHGRRVGRGRRHMLEDGTDS